jgi:hypothetical protein
MAIESAVFTVVALNYFGLIGNVGKIYTFGFAYIALSGVFTLMIARQRQDFFKSRPSMILTLTVLAEVLLVLAICFWRFGTSTAWLFACACYICVLVSNDILSK